MCAKFKKDPAKDAVFIHQSATLPIFKMASILSDTSGASIGNRTTNSRAQIDVKQIEGVFYGFPQFSPKNVPQFSKQSCGCTPPIRGKAASVVSQFHGHFWFRSKFLLFEYAFPSPNADFQPFSRYQVINYFEFCSDLSRV